MDRAIRRGFTLVEVLVILAILAALAAILVPTVANQVRKADIGRVTGDVTNLRTGVEAFLVNVHRYPGDIEDLTLPLDGSDADINGASYPPGLQSRWEGPYIDQTITDGGTIETGFAAGIQDDFVAIDVDGNGVNFLTIYFQDLAVPELIDIDAQIDSGDSATLGQLRWWSSSPPAVDSVHFYALPIN